MDQKQFLEYCDQHNLKPEARQCLDRIRTSDPARRVGGGTKNLVQRFASLKMGVTIQAESKKPEFEYIVLLEHDDDVLEFYDQPLTVTVQSLGKAGKLAHHPYTPDLLVLSKSKGPVFVECKRDEFVLQKLSEGRNWWIDQEGHVHYEPLRAWTESVGCHSETVLASQINSIKVQNLQMLSDYRIDGVSAPDENTKLKILSALNSPPWASRRAILDFDSSITADDINWMVANDEMYVDLDHDLLEDAVRTMLFRDCKSAEIYAQLKDCRVEIDPLALKPIELIPGKNVVVDGVQYKIRHVGETGVMLEDVNGRINTWSFEQLDELIAKRLVTADPSVQSTTSEAELQRLNTASLTDLAGAMRQLEKLQSPTNEKNVPKRTLEWLMARYKKGEDLYGNGFLGLIPRISARGNRTPKLDIRVRELISDVINELILVRGATPIRTCYGELRLRCLDEGLSPPSEKTFRISVKCVQREKLEQAKRGHKAAHQHSPWYVPEERTTPRHGQRPFEIGHIDHTELSVHFVDEKFQGNTLRPWLTVLLDGFSRKVLAWHVSFDKPSYASSMCVIRDCLRRHQRGCDMYVVDNGPDFHATYFETLLARLRAHKRERKRGQGRDGSILERFFGTVEQNVVKSLKGCNQDLKTPRLLAPSHDPRKDAVWTLRAFIRELESWIEEFYHNQPHEALGVSPNVAFDEGIRLYGYRAHRRFQFTEAVRLLCLPGVRTPKGCLTIQGHQGHVRVHGIYYHGDVLLQPRLHRKKVPARFDPFDISRLYVFVDGEWRELRSIFAAELEGCSLNDLKIFSAELLAKNGDKYGKSMDRIERMARHRRQMMETEKALAEKMHAESVAPESEDVAGAPSGKRSVPGNVSGGAKKNEKFSVEVHWAGIDELAEEEQ